MLEALAAGGPAEVVYVSSSSTIVTQRTLCYEYPRVKRQAALDARRLLNARVLCLGLVYVDRAELPAGLNAATSICDLAEFMLAPRWNPEAGADTLLFELVDGPPAGSVERSARLVYDAVQWQLRSWPCLLRPVDLLLRTVGYRWYGYTNLSNRLWSSTTS